MLEFQNVTMSECGNQHLNSVGLSNWKFCYLLNFSRMRYHGLPDTIIRVTIHVIICLWKLCTTFSSF